MVRCVVCRTKWTQNPKGICYGCREAIKNKREYSGSLKNKTRVCTKCKKELMLNEFYRDKNKTEGHKSICKKCYSQYYQNYKREMEIIEDRIYGDL